MIGDHCRTLKLFCSNRHEIDERCLPGTAKKTRFQYVGVRQIPTLRAERSCRRDRPVATFLRIENSGEDRGAIETGPAQPVNRSVARYKSSCAAVTDYCVIMNFYCHRFIRKHILYR